MGEIVVIGGLMANQTNEVSSGIPLLEDIPYFGFLFKHVKQESSKTELVILLKATIAESSVEGWTQRLRETKERFIQASRGFHAGSKPEIFGTEGETFGE